MLSVVTNSRYICSPHKKLWKWFHMHMKMNTTETMALDISLWTLQCHNIYNDKCKQVTTTLQQQPTLLVVQQQSFRHNILRDYFLVLFQAPFSSYLRWKCFYDTSHIWIPILLVYKAVELALSLGFAFKTCKVKTSGSTTQRSLSFLCTPL